MALVYSTAAEFNSALSAFARGVGYTIEYAALREASLMCRDALVFTPPFKYGGGGGETKQAELVGDAAVKRDINSIFVAQNDKSKVTASMHLKSLSYNAGTRNFGDFNKARQAARQSGIEFASGILNKIIRDTNEQRAFAKATNYFSSVPVRQQFEMVQDLEPIHHRLKWISRQGKTKITKNQGGYGANKFMVSSKSELNAYIKKEQALVGKLKSGWWNVLMSMPKPRKNGAEKKFGQKGVASYVKRFSGNTILFVNSRENAVNVLFGNSIGDNDDKGTMNNVLALMYTASINRMAKDLDQFLDRDARRFNAGSSNFDSF